MSTQNVTAQITFNMSVTEIITSGLLTPLQLPAALIQQLNYTNATTNALTIDQVHAKVYTLAASTTTIDLTSLTDLGGNSVNFARVRDFLVYNADTTTAHIVNVYKGASNGWSFLPASTSELVVTANGGIIWLHDPNSALSTNGYVTGGSSKTITLDPGANTVNLSVLIIGGTVS